MIGVTRVLRATLRPAADLIHVAGEATAALGLLTTGLLFRTLTSLEAPHGPDDDAPAATDAAPPPRPRIIKAPEPGLGPVNRRNRSTTQGPREVDQERHRRDIDDD